ncbi:MAG TPA: glycosyltransferase family 4 protein [Solirubrobacteraceae bacterium]|nr:glycosyltransferase family 4 protein [Solirubrobacteraceae bacterium]
MSSARPPLRALFVNEGALGTGVLGHLRLHEALTEHATGVELHAVQLPPMPRASRLAVRDVPGLAALDADLQPVRWHAVQGLRLRRALAHTRAVRPQVVCVNTHTIALFAQRPLARAPTVFMADASVWQWHAMGIWRTVRRHSRALIEPSLRRERRALEAAHLTLAATAWAADGLRAVAPAARIEVHHAGLDVERFRPAPRAPGDRVRVLFVGGRFSAKGGHALIDALAPRLGADVTLDVVTPDPVAARPGVRVHRLSGASPELVALYQQADLLCLPTRGDAAPWVVLEAMACATPVLATAIGGIPELVGDAGRLVPAGDQPALERALAELLADAAQREALGAAARARMERHYDVRRQAPRFVEVLRAAAGS